ncbi:SH3 domain-containing protein [Gemella sanguinis]
MNNQNPNNNRNYNSQNNNPNYNNDQYNNYPNDQYNQYNEQYNNPDYNGQYNNPGYTGQHYDNQNTQYNNTVNDQQYYNQQNNQQYNVPPVNPNYNNYNDNNSYNEEPKNEKKKSPIPIIITAIVTFLVLVVALYFGYNKFMKKENVVDVSAYEINFVTYGTNGEGKPEVDIKKIPEVANTSTEISNFLSKPDISYDKKENLKNGDKVEVTITLNHNTAQKLKLDTKGEFKRTFTVNGLNEKEKEKEKEKETIIVKDNSSSSSSSSDSNRTYFSNRAARIYVDAGVNLRSSSNDSSSVISTAKKGDTVYVDFTERNSRGETWAFVTYNGKQGWMRADLIGH